MEDEKVNNNNERELTPDEELELETAIHAMLDDGCSKYEVIKLVIDTIREEGGVDMATEATEEVLKYVLK